MPTRILVVDDDVAYLRLMQTLLEDAGYEVETAETFHVARHAVTDQSLDLVLVDIRLGQYNGLQLVAEISVGLNPIPTIVISGFDDSVLRADALAFGAPFLVKPVATPELLQAIEERLRVSAKVHRPIHHPG